MRIIIRRISFVTIFLLIMLAPLSFQKSIFQTAQQNPSLNIGCGLNVALVLDASGSVALADALGDVKEASQSFLGGLKDTKSKASMWWFGGKASALVPSLTSVTDQSLSADGWFGAGLNRYISEKPQEANGVVEHKYDGVGSVDNEASYATVEGNARELTWTNWDDALMQINGVVGDPNKKPDMVVLFTDGTPSAYNLDTAGDLFYDTNNSDDIAVNLQSQNQGALARAVEQADLLKQQGIKVFTVGVGNVVSYNGIEGLKQVSGPNVVNIDNGDRLNIKTDDVLLTSNFSNLSQAMQTLVNEMCKGSLTINKKLQYNNGDISAGQSGWQFNASSDSVEIVGDGTTSTQTGSLTDIQGQASFSWDSNQVINSDSSDFSIHIEEKANSKWSFDSLQCIDQSANNELEVVSSTSGGYDIKAAPNSNIVCDATNSYIASNGLEVTKSASKQVVNGLNGGEEVIYTYNITNVGEETLTQFSMIDDKCSPIVLESGLDITELSLDSGQSTIATCTKALEHELFTEDISEINVISVNAKAPDGSDVSGQAQAEVKIITPGINVEKTVDKSKIWAGETVTYFYEVTNIGNTPLHEVNISDDKCSDIVQSDGDDNNDGLLDQNEKWHFSCVMQINSDTTNIVSVGAKDELGNSVNAKDELTVTVGLSDEVKGLTAQSGGGSSQNLPFTGFADKAVIPACLFSVVGFAAVYLYRRRVWL